MTKRAKATRSAKSNAGPRDPHTAGESAGSGDKMEFENGVPKGWKIGARAEDFLLEDGWPWPFSEVPPVPSFTTPSKPRPGSSSPSAQDRPQTPPTILLLQNDKPEPQQNTTHPTHARQKPSIAFLLNPEPSPPPPPNRDTDGEKRFGPRVIRTVEDLRMVLLEMELFRKSMAPSEVPDYMAAMQVLRHAHADLFPFIG